MRDPGEMLTWQLARTVTRSLFLSRTSSVVLESVERHAG